MLKSFFLAVQFLSRIPTPAINKIHDSEVGISVLFYPLVGLLIGCIIYSLAWLATDLSPNVLSALLIALWVMITGGLHLDGLADCADAWAGGAISKERSLEIMKDPASGPIAVTVLILTLMIKWAAISNLIVEQKLIELVMVPVLGRLSILAVMLSTPYISKKGLGEKMHENLPVVKAKIILLSGLLLCIYIMGLLPIAIVILVIWLLRRLALNRLGGSSGDVFGAILELSETAALVALSG